MKRRSRGWLCVGLVAALAAAFAGWRLSRGHNGLGVSAVVLVTIDTVRADRLGAWGGDPAVSPTLDRLAREGVRFERCLTTAPITLPAHASILSGTDPIAHGVRVNGAWGFAAENPSLAKVMQDAGFVTGACVSAFVLDQRFGLDVGFDEYDDRLLGPDGAPDPGQDERRGERTVAAALDFVTRAGSAPFFLWVHLFDAHAPYEAPAPFASRFEHPYDAEVAYVDHCIARLLDGLRERKRLQDALVAVVADHGEGLGDHGESTHTVFVYDSTVHVPWILWSAGRLPSGSVVRPTVSVTSVAPTLLDLLDLDVPPGMYGRSRADLVEGTSGPPARGDVARFESLAPEYYYGFAPLVGVEDQGEKLIVAPRPELYRVAADPAEQQNLFAAEPSVAGRLKRLLDTYELAHATGRAEPVELSAQGEVRLRQLGYLAGHRGGGDGRDPKDGIGIVEALQEAALASRDDPAAAVARLEELLAAEPDVAEAHELLGDLRAATDAEAALASLRAARRLQPTNPELYAKEGMLLAALGRQDESEQVLKAALDLDPGQVRARVQLGYLHLADGRMDLAKRRFDEVLQQDPDVVGARLGRAECLLQLGNVRLADQDLREALAVEPRNLRLLARLVEVNVLLRNLEDALRFRARARELEPEATGWAAEVEEELVRSLAGS